MVIAVNTRFLLKHRLEGIGRFTYEILKRITIEHKEHTFIFFFDRKVDETFLFSDNVIPVVLFPPARHPFLWYWYFEISVTKALKRFKADVFITMDGWLSLRTKVKTLQVLHDLHYKNHPEFLPPLVRKYYQYYFPKFVRKADQIVTVSYFCKKEIMENYSIENKNIDVVYNSTRSEYYVLSKDEIHATKKQYTEGRSYFLFIGPIHPRKNLSNAIKAYYKYKNTVIDDIKLVVTGSEMWKNFDQYQELKDNIHFNDIIFTGYLSPSELFKVTGAANCLLYVSFYEGFGMPVLEAMSCNVPVITSNRSAMPEIAGEAALFIDPYSVNSIYNAMRKMQSDLELRKELIIKGQNNLNRFSWDNSAKLFWKSILKTS